MSSKYLKYRCFLNKTIENCGPRWGRLSKSTKSCYTDTLREFIEFADISEPVTVVQASDYLVNFIEEKVFGCGEKISAASANRYVASINYFMFNSHGFFSDDISEEKRRYIIDSIYGVMNNVYKDPEKLPQRNLCVLTDIEISKLIEIFCKQGKEGVRHAVIVALCFFGGRRISEVLSLRVGSITLEDGQDMYLRVMSSKTECNEKKYPVVGSQFYPLIMDFCENIPPAQEYYFETSPGKVITYDAVNKYLKKYSGLVVDYIPTTHSLRRSFVTEARKLGVSDVDIQKFTGHSRLDTLNRYDFCKKNFGKTRLGLLGRENKNEFVPRIIHGKNSEKIVDIGRAVH